MLRFLHKRKFCYLGSLSNYKYMKLAVVNVLSNEKHDFWKNTYKNVASGKWSQQKITFPAVYMIHLIVIEQSRLLKKSADDSWTIVDEKMLSRFTASFPSTYVHHTYSTTASKTKRTLFIHMHWKRVISTYRLLESKEAFGRFLGEC